MHLKPEEITENGYVLIDRLEHNEIAPFVKTYLSKWTRFSIIYYVSNILTVSLLLFYFLKNNGSANFSISNAFSHTFYGFCLTFALIPIHEYIHSLAYKSQGAKQTSYDANWKKFYFMAVADKFVANRKEFQIVALAPFVTITLVLIMLLFFVSKLWAFTILGILFTHTSFCSGDFGLLSYFDYYKDKEVITYDDKDNKLSYFYSLSK